MSATWTDSVRGLRALHWSLDTRTGHQSSDRREAARFDERICKWMGHMTARHAVKQTVMSVSAFTVGQKCMVVFGPGP
jgi:hypothetical protein